MGGQGRLLLLLLTFAVTGSESYSRYTDNPLLIYDMCARQEGVPEVDIDNQMVKTLYEIAMTPPAIELVLNCVANKVESTGYFEELNEWFVNQTFDMGLAEQALTEAKELFSTGHEFECLRQGLGWSMYSCLVNNINSISYIWYMNETDPDVCSATQGECRNVQFMSLGCSSKDLQLANVISKLVYGRCLEGWPTPENALPMNNTFTQCAEQVFPGQAGDQFLAMAFPPSEYSQQELGDWSAYSVAHVNAMSTLCSNIPAYTSCIQGRRDAMTLDDGWVYDAVTRHFNTEDLQAVLSTYCTNQELIASQFLCTYDAVSQSHCGGGLMDVLNYVHYAKWISSSQICRRITTSQHCRIQDLRQCNEEYAVVMAQFYIDLKDQCKHVGPDGDNLGQFLGCAREIGEQVGEKIEAAGGGGRDINKTIAIATDYICSKRKQMVTCASDVYGTTDNLLDRLITTFLRPENIEALLDSICSVKEDLKESVLCIVSEVAQKHGECLKKSGEGLSAALQNVMTWAHIHSYETAVTKIPNLCSAEETFLDCVGPAVQTCSPSLATWFDGWTSNFMSACGNPNVVSM